MLLRMARRSETAAETRRSLLDAAAALLDLGGVEAVTLREVGARAGVSRSAAYRHFADKQALLNVLATNALSELGDALEFLAASDDPPRAVPAFRAGFAAHHRPHPASPVSPHVHRPGG
jgi:AcrR family transcriptional regulator